MAHLIGTPDSLSGVEMKEYSEPELEDFGVYLLSRFFLSRGNEEYMKRTIGELVREAIEYWKVARSMDEKEKRSKR